MTCESTNLRRLPAPRAAKGGSGSGARSAAASWSSWFAEAAKVLQQQDGYAYTKTDEREVQQQWPQLKALSMIDREGIVRWANIECADKGLAGLGKMPSEDTILGAARACVG
jgi:hypothetical protein